MHLDIYNPATGKRLARVPADESREIVRKAAEARAAQCAWAATPLSERLATIRRFRNRIVAETEELAQLLTAETAKPITQARNELRGFIPRIDFFLEETPAVLRARTALSDRRNGLQERITREPLGVVGNISAWNYPYFVGGNVLIPALLTGNAVVYKPSEHATLTGLAIVERLVRSGVPAPVIACVVGGAAAGTALLRQPLDGVFFTGSHATGRKVAQAVARRFVKLQLELGGKDPVYVCEDVDVAKAAASTADGVFYNNGQSCCSIERLYVHEAIFDAFVEAFVSVVKRFTIGDPRRPDTYLGPLTRPAQLEVLTAQVRDARKKGARVLTGGMPLLRPRNSFGPTVLIDVNHDMDVMREESFGPIVGIMAVHDDDEAIKLMNDTRYGLTAGVYTRDEKRATNILKQVRAGSAYWNCCDRVSPRLPWVGIGNSGAGVTLSRDGIETFTRPRGWHLRQTP